VYSLRPLLFSEMFYYAGSTQLTGASEEPLCHPSQARQKWSPMSVFPHLQSEPPVRQGMF